MGVPGYCGNQEVERLKTEGVRFEPDLVLFFTYEYPNVCRGEVHFEGDKMYWGRVPRNTFRKVLSFVGKNVYLYWPLHLGYDMLRDAVTRSLEIWPAEEPKPFDLANEALEVLSAPRDVVREKNFTPIVLYIPTKTALSYEMDPTIKKTVKLIEAYCQKEQWGFLDPNVPLKEYWVSEKKFPYFQYDEHWNIHGHRAVAHAVARYLRDKSFLEPAYFKLD